VSIKVFILFSVIFALSCVATAQVAVIPKIYDLDSTDLPVASPYYREGTAFLVINALNQSDCSAGGGSVTNWCCSNGSGSWSVCAANNSWVLSGTDLYYSAGDVGIGTDNPLYELEIESATADLYVQSTGTDSTSSLRLANDAQQWILFTNTNDNFYLRDATGSTNPFVVSTTAPNSSFVIAADGDVGVGIASPGYDLHVLSSAGNGNVTSRLECDDANCTAIQSYENDARVWGIGVNAGDDLQIRDNTGTANVVIIEDGASANSLYIEDDGDVGIGAVTNPSQALEVNGNVLADNVRLNAYDYGELYEDTGSPGTTIDVATAGNFYGWVSATSGDLNNITADIADATADHLTIATDGAYAITASLAFSGTVSALVECAIFESGVELTHLKFYRKLSAAGDVGSASISGVETLEASDEISLRCTSDSNGDDVNVWAVNLTVVGIG
jgi:hypothetical protein